MFIPNKISFTYSGVTCSVISSSFLHILFKQYPLPYFLFEDIMNKTFGLTHSLFQKWVISKSVWSPCLPHICFMMGWRTRVNYFDWVTIWIREGFKNKIKKKYGIFHTFFTPPLRWGKVWNLFMIFFQHPRDKFPLFFDTIHKIWDQG